MEKKTLDETWRAFAELFYGAYEAWKVHRRNMIQASRKEMDNVSREFAKHLAQPFQKATFDGMLKEVADYCRTGGGFEIIQPKPLPKPKPKPDLTPKKVEVKKDE